MLCIRYDQSSRLLTLREKSVAGCLQDARFAGAGAPPGRAHTDLSGGCWSGRAAAVHLDSPPQCKQRAETPDYLQMHSSIWDWQNTCKSFPLWLLVAFLCGNHHAISVCNTAFPCSQTHDNSNFLQVVFWLILPKQNSFYSTHVSQVEREECRLSCVPGILWWSNSNPTSWFAVCMATETMLLSIMCTNIRTVRTPFRKMFVWV